MNRRSLLALIGIAPIATAAAALPRVADPVKLASTGGREVSAKAPFIFQSGELHLDHVSLSTLSSNLGSVDISRATMGTLICGAMDLSSADLGPTSYCFKADRFDISPVDENGYIRLTERKSS